MNDLLNRPDHIGGYRIVVEKDRPAYRHQYMTGKHRSKRKRGRCRVIVFSHWANLLLDGEVIKNDRDRYMVMNPRTYTQLQRAV